MNMAQITGNMIAIGLPSNDRIRQIPAAGLNRSRFSARMKNHTPQTAKQKASTSLRSETHTTDSSRCGWSEKSSAKNNAAGLRMPNSSRSR